MTELQDYDIRLSGERQSGVQALSILVAGTSHDDARAQAISLAELDGWRNVRVLWAVLYPAKLKVRPTRAITDE